MLQRQNLPKPCLCSVQLLRIDCWNKVPKRLHFEQSITEMFSVSHNGIGFFLFYFTQNCMLRSFYRGTIQPHLPFELLRSLFYGYIFPLVSNRKRNTFLPSCGIKLSPCFSFHLFKTMSKGQALWYLPSTSTEYSDKFSSSKLKYFTAGSSKVRLEVMKFIA